MNSDRMLEVRCPNCNRLLLKVMGVCTVEVKCPRCHRLHLFYTIKQSVVVAGNSSTEIDAVQLNRL